MWKRLWHCSPGFNLWIVLDHVSQANHILIGKLRVQDCKRVGKFGLLEPKTWNRRSLSVAWGPKKQKLHAVQNWNVAVNWTGTLVVGAFSRPRKLLKQFLNTKGRTRKTHRKTVVDMQRHAIACLRCWRAPANRTSACLALKPAGCAALRNVKPQTPQSEAFVIGLH